ncbi:MAG: Crp/Fnr family transcriptional regulator [Candidatus Sericytochromatia bacterium]
MEIKEDAIRKQRHFKDLPAKYLQALIRCAQVQHFDPDTPIFKLGGPAEAFYLIQSGSVAIEMFSSQRGTVRIQTLHEGDLLGWSWLYPPYKWHFDAHTLEDCQILVFDAKAFLDQCEEDHEMGYQMQQRFGRIMVERLQATRLQLLDLYGAQP